MRMDEQKDELPWIVGKGLTIYAECIFPSLSIGRVYFQF